MKLRHPRRWRWFDWLAAVVFVLLAVGSAVAVWWVGRHAVSIRKLTTGVGDTVFYTADGRAWFRMDEQRRDVPLSQISPWLRNAVVAVEDHRFYKHWGIDPIGVGRAVVENVRTDNVQGASTITQQLARTLFLSNKRTWARKAKEAVLALMLEQQLSKNRILELYLNRVYLSSGVYGVEPLSRRLFGKSAHDLTLAEGALVAGLIRAPSALSPWSNLDGALARSHVVLTRMREERYITASQERQAARTRVRIRPFELAVDARGAYVKEWLRQQFRNEFGGDHPPDWQARTTVLPDVQEAAERAAVNGLRRSGIRDLQAALVALDPATGDVLAMVGGRDFRATPFNRAIRSRRQPGSAFKPIVFAAALERGWSPVSLVTGLASIEAQGDEEWIPRNAGGEVADRVPLRQALLESNNRAAVALQSEIGTRTVLRLARQVGLHDLPDVPSLALGSGLVTPLELTRAFAMFPNGGFDVAPRGLVSVLDADGSVVFAADVRRREAISPQVAFQMVSMLEDVVSRGTAASVRSAGVRFPVGGKTGTTNEFKDAWFVGFSSSVVAGVWVGFDQPATIGRNAFGARLAAPIWAEFMRYAARRYRPQAFTAPRGIDRMELCRVSYLKPVRECPTYVEYFKDGDARPDRLCALHEGSFKQEAQRAVQGLLDGLWRRLFGRRSQR
jgi:penicillin-binding protein 1A